MKTYQTNEIKNIALIGNSGSGKTTLAESMLFDSGVIERKGTIKGNNTVSDYNDIEHENLSSVFSTVLYAEFNNKKINIIDTPGADDFIGGVISAFKVIDTSILLLNAQHGVEVGTEILTRYCKKYNKPIILAVNQLDHEKANFENTIETAKQSMGNKVIIVQYPVNIGPAFDALIDVLLMKMYKFNKETGDREILPIPEDQKEKANELHNTLVEAAAENDESLMELYFEKGSLNENEMRKGITIGLINRDILPLFCMSAEKGMGVKRIMEFVTNVAPSPNEMEIPLTTEGKEIECKSDGATSLFVFKSSNESHIGEINFFKVMSGEISENMDLINNNTETKERISQIFAMSGKNRTKLTKLCAGDIGGTVKLKNTKTNHTLSDSKVSILLPEINFVESKYRTAIKAVNESDEEKLGEALGKIHEIDPTIIIEYSKELKQIIIHGQGEYHLNNIVKWHLDNLYKVETNFLLPKIPYRETITKIANADYRHKKQSGGSGQFGEVHLIIEPYKEGASVPTHFKIDGKETKLSVRNREEHDLPWGGKLIYNNCIVGGSIDARFMPAILKGVMEKITEGPLTGCYARDICVYVYDGKMHPVDSNEVSFKIAGRTAFSEAFKNAGPKIMEPVYSIEILVPSDRMGDVMSDLQGRRAMIEGMNSERGFEKISAKVPLAEMNKYSTSLSSITGGRATYSMTFDKYNQVPMDVQKVLIKKFEEEQKEE